MISRLYSLLTVQFLIILQPIFVITFLTSQLGVEGYGEYSSFMVFCVLINTVSEFGFNTVATTELVNTQSHNKLAKYVDATICLILLMSAVLLGFFYGLGDRTEISYFVAALAFSSFSAMTPYWYYAGTNNLANFRNLRFIQLSLSVILILLAPIGLLSFMIAYAIAIFSSLLFTDNILKWRLKNPSFSLFGGVSFISILKASGPAFTHKMSLYGLLNGMLITVSIHHSDLVLGAVTLFERIRRSIQGVLDQFTLAVFSLPKVNKFNYLSGYILFGLIFVSILPWVSLYLLGTFGFLVGLEDLQLVYEISIFGLLSLPPIILTNYINHNILVKSGHQFFQTIVFSLGSLLLIILIYSQKDEFSFSTLGLSLGFVELCILSLMIIKAYSIESNRVNALK